MFETGIIAIVGDVGTGKTLFSTILGFLNYLLFERDVLSNYVVKYPYKNLNIEDIIKFKPKLQNKVILIDEMPVIMDSRRSQKKSNLILSYFFNQTRKRGVLLYYTSQGWKLVDIRLRNRTNYLVVCTNPYKLGKSSNPDLFIVEIYKVIGGEIEQQIITFSYYGKPFYNLYDTYEVIDIFEENL